MVRHATGAWRDESMSTNAAPAAESLTKQAVEALLRLRYGILRYVRFSEENVPVPTAGVRAAGQAKSGGAGGGR